MAKKQFDVHLRACWTVPSGSWLVGTDADGIQLRVLADYLWRHFDADQYAQAIMKGKKEDETDITSIRKPWQFQMAPCMAKIYLRLVIGRRCGKDFRLMVQKEENVYCSRMSIDGLYNPKNQLCLTSQNRDTSLGMMDAKFQYPMHTKNPGILQNGRLCLMKHSQPSKMTKLDRSDSLRWLVSHRIPSRSNRTEEEAKRLGQIQADCMLETGQEIDLKYLLQDHMDRSKRNPLTTTVETIRYNNSKRKGGQYAINTNRR